jgi:hypothetical protein
VSGQWLWCQVNGCGVRSMAVVSGQWLWCQVNGKMEIQHPSIGLEAEIHE